MTELGINNNEEKKEERKKATAKWLLFRQTLTALGPILSTISVGITFGYSAILLPQLHSSAVDFWNGTSNSSVANIFNEDNVFPRIIVHDPDTESWIASSGALLMAPGCWLSGLLMDVLGRKTSHLILSPIFLAGWILIGVAPNVFVLIAGRLLCGLCVGLQGPLGPVYVAETSEPRLRGILLAGISLAVAVGILISHVLGTWLSWRVAAHLSGVFPVLCFVFCLLAPKSPAWLLKKNRVERAREVWLYLRGDDCDTEFESMKVGESVDEDTSLQDKDVPLWRTGAFLKPLFILNVFFFTAQFSGVNAIAFYTVQLFQDVSGPAGRAYEATLILDVIRVVASFLACWLTRIYSRRTLTMVSGVGSFFSLLGLGLVTFLDLGKAWPPTTFLFGYICSVSIGLVPLPWLLCGELFPAALRGLGSGISSGFAFICFFVVVKTGPIMFHDLGTSGTFAFYGSVALCGTVFLYFFLPETKDKTLREIEDKFTNRRTERSTQKNEST